MKRQLQLIVNHSAGFFAPLECISHIFAVVFDQPVREVGRELGRGPSAQQHGQQKRTAAAQGERSAHRRAGERDFSPSLSFSFSLLSLSLLYSFSLSSAHKSRLSVRMEEERSEGVRGGERESVRQPDSSRRRLPLARWGKRENRRKKETASEDGETSRERERESASERTGEKAGKRREEKKRINGIDALARDNRTLPPNGCW